MISDFKIFPIMLLILSVTVYKLIFLSFIHHTNLSTFDVFLNLSVGMLVCLSVNVCVYISFFVPVCVCTCVYLYLFISQNSSCQVGYLSYICHLSTYLSVSLSFSVLVWLSLCTYLNFYLIVSVYVFLLVYFRPRLCPFGN